jgi:hypothetical protein
MTMPALRTISRLLIVATGLAAGGVSAECDIPLAAQQALGEWQCEFETDMGVAPLRLTLEEVRGDSVLGTYEYTTPLTGLVRGEVRGDLFVTAPGEDQPEGTCTYRLQGSWSEVTAGGFTGSGDLTFDFVADRSFTGYWTEFGGAGRYRWNGKKVAAASAAPD